MEKSLTHCEIIPNRIIQRNNNHAQRKVLINKKFQWLNKYLSSNSPTSIKINQKIKEKQNTIISSKRSFIRRRTKIRTLVSQDLKQSNILTTKDLNKPVLQKTSSHSFNYGKMKSQSRVLSRFLQTKSPHTQFSKYKPIPKQSFTSSNINKVEDFDLKPWNTKADLDEGDILKENIFYS